MIEMRLGCLKCSLTVALVVCTYIVGSGANGGSSGAFASASAYAGAGGFALSNAGAFGGAGDFSGVYDGHKGIRSYDSTSFSHDNDANRGAKSHGAVPGHGVGGDGIKGSDHGYNKNDCSKCKWENDDYWERDEPEEEGDENDGDDCDDGQYKPDGTRHRGAGGSGKGHAPGSHPSGVHKTGPTGVYVDEGGRPAGPFSGAEYPVPTTGYAAPTGGFGIGSTPKPGSGWNTPFPHPTLKPGYAGTTAGVYGTTSSSQPEWNKGITPGSFATTSRPWGGSSGPAGSFVTTPKPGANWDTGSGAPTSGQPSWKPWNTGHDGTPVASTSRPGQGWNTGFGNTPTTGFSQKPAPGWNTGHQPTGSFGVTSKSEPNWNTGFDNTPAGGLPSSRKPGSWSDTPGHDGANFHTTPKPGQSWNAPSGGKPEPSWNPDHGTSAGTSGCPRPDSGCTQSKGPFKLGATPINIDRSDESPSGISAAGPQTGSGLSPPNSYGSPRENQNWPYGQSGIQSTGTYPGASVTPGVGNIPHGGTPNFGKKDHPFFNKPTSTQTPYSGVDQAHPNINTGTYGPGSVSDYNKPRHEWSPNVANTVGTTKRPFGGINSPGTGVQGNTFNSGKLPGSPTESSAYPSTIKPNFGSGISPGQPASGSNVWYNSGTTISHTGFPVPTTGFGTTKSPFGHTNIPGPTPGNSYGGTGLKQPSFNVAGSSASAGASAFGTFPGTYSTHYTTPTTPTYEGASDHPGVKSSPRPAYGVIPHTHPDAGTSGWPGKQPGSEITSGRQPGSGITLGGYPGSGSDTWPGKQPDNSGSWPSKKPGDGSNTWPGKQPESVSATWPTRQPGSGTGSWPSGKPGDKSGTTTGGHPGTISDTWPGRQFGDNNRPWPSAKPGDGSKVPSGEYPGSISGIWPGKQPGSISGVSPTRQPSSGSGGWPNEKPGDGSSATPGNYPGFGSGIGPNKQPESGAWPSNQPEDGSRTRPSECSNVNCGSAISSNCGGENYNCGGSCTGRDNNTPITPCRDIVDNRPCSETNGSSGVDKTYYPAGTGDGHVPNIGNTYGSASPVNNGIGAYPGNVGCRSGDNSCNQGANVTPEDPVRWNSVNPFLFGGGNPKQYSSPQNSETTTKPIGKGNPFLNSGRNDPKPEYSNANNDRNVIPYGEENTKPIGQDNPFLNNKRRGDPNESVIPLGGNKPEKNNPFFGSGNRGPDGPYTGGQPDGYPALGKPESGGVKGGSRGVSPQQENSGGVYPTDGNPHGVDPLRCKLGIFGCGTPGSGSYEAKHPGKVLGGFGGGIETGGANSGNVGNVPGGPGDPGTGINRGQVGAGHFASAGSNLPGSFSGAYAGSFAQASSLANAKSLPFPGSAGSGNDFGQARNWPSSAGVQNQGGSNSWASSSAFAGSNSGSWSGHYPTDVKG